MLRHLGYMAATQSIDACAGRTCRPGDATPDRLRALIRDNLRDLARILQFNAERGIGLYRVSSLVIPMAALPGSEVAWWDEFSGDLGRIGQFVRRSGLRLEMHPGLRCLLNAPSPETVALSILELGWHVRFLDALQLDASHKLVVRVGGMFGDKFLALDRFVSVINALPDAWKSRLVVENDEARYGLADVLEASERTGLPVAFGWLAHGANPGDDPDLARLLARCFDTWKPADGPPIVHLGSPAGAGSDRVHHADWVEPGDFARLIALTPAGTPFDCLLEATQGDRSLFDLLERMAIREGATLFDPIPAPIF
jgi:UV DNA damage endonuclease